MYAIPVTLVINPYIKSSDLVWEFFQMDLLVKQDLQLMHFLFHWLLFFIWLISKIKIRRLETVLPILHSLFHCVLWLYVHTLFYLPVVF